MNQTQKRFETILAAAKADPNIIGFWLDGSRGKGIVTKYSDYDCTMIVKDRGLAAYKKQYEQLGEPEIELRVRTLEQFERYAAWGSPEAWDRYNFAHVKALVDKTGGKVQALIEEKGLVPRGEIRSFIHGSLDQYLNQVYRSIKCLRDGHKIGARLEAAEAIPPLLSALFALHGGRLR